MSEENLNFHLGEKVMFNNITEVYDKLKAVDLSSAKSIALDSEDLEELDLIGLQMFSAFVKKAEKHGVSVSWDNPTIELFEAVTDLGFNAALKL